jgi:hypothetical protein
MFNEYSSKPCIRLAHEVIEGEIHDHPDESTSTLVVGEVRVDFKHYEPVMTGDYVVRLTEEDTYHCSRPVFLERNLVPGVNCAEI